MILGTAGHVDHGKTALVTALTGVDTDRLPEEKRRGITLELGFAHLRLPSGTEVGVIDVPGHERFVRAMAAGAGGVDVALLVVAADEGVRPQTREHVDICTLLGVRRGVLVVTKADLLPSLGDGWLELLEADVRALCVGTAFDHAPLVAVSAKTGEGLEALRATLDTVVGALSAADGRNAEGPLFLPIDRAFSVKGFGVVVTGSLLSGRLSAGQSVALVPAGSVQSRVRSVQVHGASVDEARAGTRVAVNLPELELAQVTRGLAVVREGELAAVKALDVEVTALAACEAPLKRRSRQLVCLGTAQQEAVLALLDRDELRPGETCFAQLRFAAPMAALAGQRFIVRGTRALSGRGATLGGGRVLSLGAPRRRRGGAAKLAALAAAPPVERVLWFLVEAGYAGLTERELFARVAVPQKELTRALEGLSSRGEVVLVDREQRRFLEAGVLEALGRRAVAVVEAFHAEAPERDALPREALRSKLQVTDEKLFARVLTTQVDAQRLELEGEGVRQPGRGRAFTAQAAQLRDEVATALRTAGLAPLAPGDLASRLRHDEPRVTQLLQSLVAEGRAVRAGPLFFDAGAVSALEGKLVAWLEQKGRISTADFKDLTGQSRKFAIPLAEYFDRENVTLRVGEERTLRRKRSQP
jgi:selenocysteine-specific elongation factor